MIYTAVDQLIGGTPLLKITNIQERLHLYANVLVKLECFNPAGSVKDRVAKAMLDAAERDGKVTKDTVIIEPTSGNTGIGLAAVAAARGYHCVIVMPDTMSRERIALMQAYGATVELSDGKLGMKGAIARAEELAAASPSAFIPSQFDNPANPQAHIDTTGPEIWADTDGNVDIFVAGVGTGGTLTGVGRYLKAQNPAVRVIAVEPQSSPLLSQGQAGPHGIQGIGANFVPSILDKTVYDDIITVSDEQAFAAARMLGKEEGVLAGISSGAALHAAISLAKQTENQGKTIVALLPDTGDRYLSTGIFE